MARRKMIKNPKQNPRKIKKRIVETQKLARNRYNIMTYVCV
jgi:hypothetical protein